MSGNKRLSNEKEFDEWIEKQNGGRIYPFQIPGKHGWVSKYLKETNATKSPLNSGRKFMMNKEI